MRQSWSVSADAAARAAPRRHRFARWHAVMLALCCHVLGADALLAQGGVVAGTVVAEQSLTPISDAQVTVEGTSLGSVTDASGRFRIAGVPGAQVTLAVRRIGYRNLTQSARVGDTNLRITLVTRAVELDEVVVTGTPRATSERAGELGLRYNEAVGCCTGRAQLAEGARERRRAEVKQEGALVRRYRDTLWEQQGDVDAGALGRHHPAGLPLGRTAWDVAG